MFSLTRIIFYEINRLFKLRDIVMEMEIDEDISVVKLKIMISEIHS